MMANNFDEKVPDDPVAKLMYYIDTVDLISFDGIDPFKYPGLFRLKDFNNYKQMNVQDQAAIWDIATDLNPYNTQAPRFDREWLTRFYHEPLYELAKKFNIWPKIQQVFSKLSSLIAYEGLSSLSEQTDLEFQEIQAKNDHLLKEKRVEKNKVAKLMFYLSIALKEGDKNLLDGYSTSFDLIKLSKYEDYAELSERDLMDLCVISLELHPDTLKLGEVWKDLFDHIYFEPIIQLHQELGLWKKCMANYWNYREMMQVEQSKQSN
jgi:hypothetical protein